MPKDSSFSLLKRSLLHGEEAKKRSFFYSFCRIVLMSLSGQRSEDNLTTYWVFDGCCKGEKRQSVFGHELPDSF